MDANKFTFEFIEDYLDGNLPEKERIDFEKKLNQDTALAKQVEQQKATHKLVALHAQLKTKERVVKIFEQSKKRKPMSKTYMIAAGLAVLLIAGFAYFNISGNYTNESLASAAFDPYPDRITTMGSGSEDLLTAGMEAYNNGNYAEAINQLSAVPDTVENTFLAKLYTGVSYLGQEQATEAISILSQLANQRSEYQEAARWYLALAYVQTGDIQKAKGFLKSVTSAQAFKSAEADKLLDDLDSFWRGSK